MNIILNITKHPFLKVLILILIIFSCKKGVTSSSKLEKAPKIDKVDTLIIDSTDNKE